MILLQLPCLPGETAEVDLNAVGGGVVKLNENEFLLTTGTPVKGHVTHKINKLAQDQNSLWGKILKLKFIENKLEVEIFSKGLRNPQGIAKLGRDIIAVEHGPRGGDEINIIVQGGNYGWPEQSFGSEYDLSDIEKSDGSLKHHNLPLFSFNPAIGISYIGECPTSYSEYYAPYNCLSISSMRGNSIFFIVYSNQKVFFTERMNFNSRIRKFFVSGDNLVGVIDFEGLIVGKFTKL